jgi:hypothetical protein
MPAGDVWGNSWLSSWGVSWRTAVTPPPSDTPALVGSGYGLTHSQYQRLLERIKRKRRRLTDDDVSLVEQAYEELPETQREQIEQQAAPVLKRVSNEDRARIDALMSERKRAAVVVIVEAWQRHQREREDEELMLIL